MAGLVAAMLAAGTAGAQTSTWTKGDSGQGPFTCYSSTNTGDWIAGNYNYPDSTYLDRTAGRRRPKRL